MASEDSALVVSVTLKITSSFDYKAGEDSSVAVTVTLTITYTYHEGLYYGR